MRVGRVGFVVLMSLLAAGCSTSSYQQQVGDLSSGFAKVTTSFEGLVEDERQAFVASQAHLGVTSGHLLSLPESCRPENIAPPQNKAKPKPVDCRAEISSTATGGKNGSRAIVFTPAAPKGLELAKKLAAYGEALVVLAAAKDVAEVKDGVAKANAAIGSLRAAVSPTGPKEPYGAITAAVVWAAGKFLDAQRVEQLKDVVGAADPTVAAAADVMAMQARLAQRSILVQRAQLLSHQTNQIAHLRAAAEINKGTGQDIGDAAVTKAADDFVTASLALQTFAKADFGKPFTAMREAHAKLLHSLKNPDLPPDFVFAQLSDFIDQVGKLNAAIVAARKAKE